MDDLSTRFVEAAHATMDAAGILPDVVVSLDDRHRAGFPSSHPSVHRDYLGVPIPLRRTG